MVEQISEDEIVEVNTKSNPKKSQWYKKLTREFQQKADWLLKQGYWFFVQEPYKKLALIEGQKVPLYYTNGFGVIILKNKDGYWHLVSSYPLCYESPKVLGIICKFQKGVFDNEKFFARKGQKNQEFFLFDINPDEIVKDKIDVYGDGVPSPAITIPCSMLIERHVEHKAWTEIARLF